MRTSITCLLSLAALFIVGCGGGAKEEATNHSAAGTVTLHAGDEKYVGIDTKESVVTWKGSNSFGTHTGNVYVSKGELKIENGQLIGGAVEIDMSTIEDENGDRKNGLIDHLKDPDFFDVQKFPFASIAITGVGSINAENKEISGDLTIKGITHPVRFPSTFEFKDGVVKATGKLVIDRTKWGIRYGSGKFLDQVKDQTISDDIEFHVKIVAKK